MSVKLRASSGSYNVRASEMARGRPVVKTVQCLVSFLDDTEANFEIDKRAKAQTLLDKVYEHLELVEKDYFGLQYVDNAPAPDGLSSYQSSESNPVITTDVMRWLDPLKPFKKQMGVRTPYRLYFRVKFYVADPSRLHEEYTRYHFFLQVKKDILEGKLVIPYKTAILLASYAVQSELGDYHADEHTSGYLSELRFIPNQHHDFEDEVSELHKQHRGLTPAKCEHLFLDEVKDLSQYGVDIHSAVWDQNDKEIQLGVTSVGLVVFQNNVRTNTFSWAKIVKISFKRKQFFIQLRKEGVSSPSTPPSPPITSDSVENLIGFNMMSYRSCKNLWKSCVEHHTFFRLHAPPALKGGFLSIGSKFRYSGKTEFQALEESKKRAKMERTFARSPSKRYARRTVGASTCDAIFEERKAMDGYRNSPHSHSVDNFRTHDGYISANSTLSSPSKSQSTIPNSTSYPNSLRTPYTNNNTDSSNGFQHSNHIRKTLPSDYKANEYPSLKRQSARTTPTRNATNQNGGPGVEPERPPRASNVTTNKPSDYRLSRSVDSRGDGASRGYDSQVQSQRKDQGQGQGQGHRKDDGRFVRPAPSAFKQNGQSTNDMGGHHSNTGSLRSNASTIRSGYYHTQLTNSLKHNSSSQYYNSDSLRSNASTYRAFSDKASIRSNASSHMTTASSQKEAAPPIPSKMIGYMDDDRSLTDQSYELPTYNDNVPNGQTHQDHHGLVTIRMKPDSLGRFGFNVKGGMDQSMPIIVSRVAPSTPADLSIPRLNEGDQVLFINGRDVSQHTHEQVVMFIKASRETHSGELVLIVRPNAVYIGDDTPDEPDFQYIPDTHNITTTLPAGGDPLASSLLLLQEALESGAALAQFEQTYRKKPGLTLTTSRLTENIPKNRYRDISPYDVTRVKLKHGDGDYINANFVNMEIKGSGIVNGYIAAQGPLPTTSVDFWQMVWDQHSTLIVMLTTNVERGRVKCHQYWPELYETSNFGSLQLTCLKEEKTASFAFRDFTLVNVQTEKKEERHIRQMQYIAWPDHGVPDDNGDFLDFVLRVRQNRVGMVEPTIVHCSAGIGRTGVLITMETAMCLIEANNPVYPLDIVRQMRDQRAMLIQTSGQYKFVCEAILRVYNDKIVQPLDDFRR